MTNNHNNTKSVVIIFIITGLIIAWFLSSENSMSQHNNEHNHGHESENHEEEIIKGPHGGRLLKSEDFDLEITIFENGLPPEFRVFSYHKGQVIAANEMALEIKLERSDNKVDHIKFSPQQDYLRGDTTIYEPHSFKVVINASYENKKSSWHYDNFEGRTQIPKAIANEMGIKAETIQAHTIIETRTFTGRVHTNPNRLSRVRPRFSGVIKDIRFELGDNVKAGDILATIQSNESLQNYQIKAPIDGIIVKRDLQIGEATGNNPLFIIADHSDVWVELDVFVRDLALINKGQKVMLETLDNKTKINATIDWVSPLTSHASQSVRARIVVPNSENLLRPGQFIRGHVTIAEHEAQMAVRQSAIQRFRDFQVVFARFNDTYEVRMLELGRRNQDWVEVLSGINLGTHYVTENSYLVKADIEKSGASHDH